MRRFLFSSAIFALLLGGTVLVVTTPPARPNMVLSGGAAGGGGSGAPTGHCAEATTFFSRVWALPATLDGTIGTTVDNGTGHRGAYDALICNLVSPDGVWAALDRLWVFGTQAATGSSTAVALLDLVTGNSAALSATAPVFTADQGFLGIDNSTTVYINTNYNPATAGGHFALNSGHISTWQTNDVASVSTNKAVGHDDGTNYTVLIPRNNANLLLCAINVSASSHTSAATIASSGHILCNRSGSAAANLQAYRRGGAVTMSPGAGTTVIPNNNMYILANNGNGTAGSGGPWQVAVFSVGGSLTPTQVSSSGTTTGTGLMPRLCQYFTALGLGPC